MDDFFYLFCYAWAFRLALTLTRCRQCVMHHDEVEALEAKGHLHHADLGHDPGNPPVEVSLSTDKSEAEVAASVREKLAAARLKQVPSPQSPLRTDA
jgi:hypothetical protein